MDTWRNENSGPTLFETFRSHQKACLVSAVDILREVVFHSVYSLSSKERCHDFHGPTGLDCPLWQTSNKINEWTKTSAEENQENARLQMKSWIFWGLPCVVIWPFFVFLFPSNHDPLGFVHVIVMLMAVMFCSPVSCITSLCNINHGCVHLYLHMFLWPFLYLCSCSLHFLCSKFPSLSVMYPDHCMIY